MKEKLKHNLEVEVPQKLIVEFREEIIELDQHTDSIRKLNIQPTHQCS